MSAHHPTLVDHTRAGRREVLIRAGTATRCPSRGRVLAEYPRIAAPPGGDHRGGSASRGDNLRVEQGEDTSVLIMVFSGAISRWGAGRFEFEHATGSLKFSRILCRDPHQIWYHRGLDAVHADVESTAELLAESIDTINPARILAIGNSMGGYAALLFGHLLDVDYVHAFAPQTCLEPDHVRRYRELDTDAKRETYERLWCLPAPADAYFDLARVMAPHNGRTTYFVHYCRESESDRFAAEHLQGVDGVHLRAYRCHGHLIARHLFKEGLLFKLLQPELQELVVNWDPEQSER